MLEHSQDIGKQSTWPSWKVEVSLIEGKSVDSRPGQNAAAIFSFSRTCVFWQINAWAHGVDKLLSFEIGMNYIPRSMSLC
jgi:hypothetical protein